MENDELVDVLRRVVDIDEALGELESAIKEEGES